MLEHYLKPGDGVIDIGAHDGTYALRYVEKVGPTGFVLSIEPGPDTVMLARSRCAAHQNIVLMQVCVDASMGERDFHLDTVDRRRNSLWPANVLKPGPSVKTQSVTLDYLADIILKPLKAIKIDAQGAEANILKGGQQTLDRPDVIWWIELWPNGLREAGSTVEDVLQPFESRGYVPDGYGERLQWDSLRREVKKYMNPAKAHAGFDVLMRRPVAASECSDVA